MVSQGLYIVNNFYDINLYKIIVYNFVDKSTKLAYTKTMEITRKGMPNMFQFSLPTNIKGYESFEAFAANEQLSHTDLLITNRFIYEPFIAPCKPPCVVLFQEEYGLGEPNDQMIDAIRADIPAGIQRVIAIGGGTVIDIAKVLTFTGSWTSEDIFTGRMIPEKARRLVVIPTTCGTGSEVTNVTICELKNLRTKKGLALQTMYADEAVLIPEMVCTLPYQFFATSSIDALIHAVESYLSPKAIAHSEIYSEKAIEMILSGYLHMVSHTRDSWKDYAENFLTASNFAGIAFGYAGCAAVHALSYPLGGAYHIPHGEANQLMFAEVLRTYQKKQPVGKLNQLEALFGRVLGVPQGQALETLYQLMDKILPCRPLKAYGITLEELPQFADSVIEGQQRLLRNNYTSLTREDMIAIYTACYGGEQQ